MRLFVSRYLNFYPSHRRTTILFHGISGAMDEVDASLGRALKMARHANGPISEELIRQMSDHDISFLKKRGHLTVAAPEEEYASFRRYVDKIRTLEDERRQRKTPSCSLMIVPSYYCNLRCPYCFQSGLHRTPDVSRYAFMDAQKVDELFERAIPAMLPHVDRLERLSLVLYGGEPFLPETEGAVQRIMEHASRHRMRVSAISNATEVHRFLRWFGPERGKVRQVQVSLDGDKPWHDCSRIGQNHRGTFETILKNVHLLVERKVTVNIRINSTKENVEGLAALSERLKDEELLGHPDVLVYSWAVHGKDARCRSRDELNIWELARRMERVAPQMESPAGRCELSLRRKVDATGCAAPLRTVACMRAQPHSFLIDPLFDIYGCYEEAGRRELRIGSYSREHGVRMEPAHADNISRHVGMFSPCDRCSIALTCGGGCPIMAQQRHGTQLREDCDYQKQCVAKAIQRLIEKKLTVSDSARMSSELWDLYPNA